jgi:acetyltransferase-like isoleucine patch superfamily enzyme
MASLETVVRAGSGGWHRVTGPVYRRYATAAGVDVAADVRFIGLPIVSRAPSSRISIGEGTVVCSAARRTWLGVNHATVLRTVRPEATLEIGAQVGISGATICAAIGVTIGAGCLLGANVTIIDTDFHPTGAAARRHAPIPTPAPSDRVVIGDNVFVGMGAMVLKGATIGDDCVIGAGAIVTGAVPAGSTVVPAATRVLSPRPADAPLARVEPRP